MSKLDLSKVKCVITDFDCTLYSGGANDKTEEYYLKYLKERGYVAKNRKSLGKILDKKPPFHNLQCVVLFLKENGYSVQDFLDYMGEHPYNFLSNEMQIVDVNVLKNLTEYYPVYLLSDSSEGYIDHYLNLFGYDKSMFVDCLSNDYLAEDMSKRHIMKKIVAVNNLKPEEVLMVGDSMQFDIVPAEDAGIQSFWVHNTKDTEYIFNELINAKKVKI